MSAYSTDKDGITSFRDENNKLLFDKAAGVNVPGWSTHPSIAGKFKNVSESTGKADTREK